MMELQSKLDPRSELCTTWPYVISSLELSEKEKNEFLTAEGW